MLFALITLRDGLDMGAKVLPGEWRTAFAGTILAYALASNGEYQVPLCMCFITARGADYVLLQGLWVTIWHTSHMYTVCSTHIDRNRSIWNAKLLCESYGNLGKIAVYLQPFQPKFRSLVGSHRIIHSSLHLQIHALVLGIFAPFIAPFGGLLASANRKSLSSLGFWQYTRRARMSQWRSRLSSSDGSIHQVILRGQYFQL